MTRGVRLGVVLAAVAVATFTWTGCDREVVADASHERDAKAGAAKPSGAKKRAKKAKKAKLREGVVLGEFRLANNPIVDGDTIWVEGLEPSVRLLGLDTEEKIESDRVRKAVEADFAAYLNEARGNSRRPVKAKTPMGNEATEFAKRFFNDADVVRLERDDPKAVRGTFGRPLAYAFVQKDGRWTSYNVEAVRAGMSPYFTKYGYSHRFHSQFARAEAEAREAERGIWDPEKKHYDDYAERQAWWNARADFIQAFEHEGAGRDDHVLLTHFDADDRLEVRLGQETTVLGVVDEVRRFRGLVRVQLSQADRARFPIIFRDDGVFRRSGIAQAQDEPVTVRGTIERYQKGDYETLQIVVSRPEQVVLVERR
ncbi:MAG: thermonuclease family protein [Myxococcota bacterium]